MSKKADDKRVQHVPVHEEQGTFDPRHPAASAFAPFQPAAGVVADDVEEKGQNLGGGPTASEAEKQFSDTKEKLAEQHEQALKEKSGAASEPAKVADDGKSASAAKKS